VGEGGNGIVNRKWEVNYFAEEICYAMTVENVKASCMFRYKHTLDQGGLAGPQFQQEGRICRGQCHLSFRDMISLARSRERGFVLNAPKENDTMTSWPAGDFEEV